MTKLRLLNVFFFSFIVILKAHSASCIDAIIIGGLKAGALQSYDVEDIQNSPLLPHQKTLFSAVAEAGETIRQHYDAAPHSSLTKLAIYIDPRQSPLSADGFNRMKVYSAYLKLKTLVDTKVQELKALEEKIYDLYYDNLKAGAEPPDHLDLKTDVFFALLDSNSTGLLDMIADIFTRLDIQASITKYGHLHEKFLLSKEECDATHELFKFLADAQSLDVLKGWLNKLFSLHKTYFEAQQNVNTYIDTAPEKEIRAIIEWMNHE